MKNIINTIIFQIYIINTLIKISNFINIKKYYNNEGIMVIRLIIINSLNINHKFEE